MYCEAHAYLRLFYFHETKNNKSYHSPHLVVMTSPIIISIKCQNNLNKLLSCRLCLFILSSQKIASHLWPKGETRKVKYFETKNISEMEYFIHLWVSLSCYLSSQTLVVEIIINIPCLCAHAGGYTPTTTTTSCLSISHFCEINKVERDGM